MARYIAYRDGQFICMGTFEELAKATGRSPSTLRSAYSKPSKVWKIVRDDYYVKLGKVNIDLIKNILKQRVIQYKEFAYDLNMTSQALSGKMRNVNSWNIDELEKVSEVLNINLDDLLK